MLTITIVIPLLAAVALAVAPRIDDRRARVLATAAAAVPLVLLVAAWLRFDVGDVGAFQLVERAEWIPTLGVAWHFGVDGIGLALATLTAVVFVAAVVHPVDTRGRGRQYMAWMLALDGVCLALFLTLDLLIFYIAFDLSLVGMYFLIARWGHGDARAAALKFFVYTLAGSLVMLLAILGLVLASDPLTFDMVELIERQPLAGQGIRATVVLAGFLVGLGIKTPVVPVHTWLPIAHVEAPAPASAVLAGVLLKMGTFGMIRIPLSMMRDTFADAAFVVALVALASILYGALVALGQTDLKRRIAYTSINHMGYVVLGIAVAATATAAPQVRSLGLVGATVEMVAHGLITGALFLVSGSVWRRGHTYDLGAYGGLAGRAPGLTAATTVAAFASLGLPGLAGFVAEVQIFAGAFAVYPVIAGVGLLGILVTAALFLTMLQQVFLGDLPARWRDFTDLDRAETTTLIGLLVPVVVIGLYPRWLLDTVASSLTLVTGALS